MSMPASTCFSTTAATAERMCALSAAISTGTPSSLANIVRTRSAGRGRLPVCVVRKRSVLRSIGRASGQLPAAVRLATAGQDEAVGGPPRVAREVAIFDLLAALALTLGDPQQGNLAR